MQERLDGVIPVQALLHYALLHHWKRRAWLVYLSVVFQPSPGHCAGRNTAIVAVSILVGKTYQRTRVCLERCCIGVDMHDCTGR